jgi:hypothetical protein
LVAFALSLLPSAVDEADVPADEAASFGFADHLSHVVCLSVCLPIAKNSASQNARGRDVGRMRTATEGVIITSFFCNPGQFIKNWDKNKARYEEVAAKNGDSGQDGRIPALAGVDR